MLPQHRAMSESQPREPASQEERGSTWLEGCMEGDFQIKARQSSQHSNCRTGANFYRYMRGKNTIITQRKQRSESADVSTVLFLLLKNSNRESEVVLS